MWINNRLALVLAIAMACCVLAGCGKTAEKAPKAPLVKTQLAGQSTAVSENSYAGVVCGRYETNMSFQVGGQIIQRNVQAGSRVNAGDVMMVINPKDVVERSNQANAQVEAARAKLNLSEKNLARYQQLYEAAAVSAAVRDQYQTAYEADLASYESAVAQAQQGYNSLEYTNLVATAAGVVASVSAEAGQVVSAGQSVLKLVQTNEYEVEINVPENRLQEVAIGKPATLTFWALSGKAEGVVREISPMADQATRTYRVRISLPHMSAGLELGMTASAELSGSSDGSGVCTLPLSAMYQTGDRPQVWLVKDGKAALKTVEVVDMAGNDVRVKGLSADDRVVTAGVHKLQEGQQVRTEADSL